MSKGSDDSQVEKTRAKHQRTVFLRNIKNMQSLLKFQASEVGRIVAERQHYDRDLVLVKDDEGFHVFPDGHRPHYEEHPSSKARKEYLQQELERYISTREDLPPGMYVEPIDNPLHIEQFPTFAVDGTSWTREINEQLDILGLEIPRAPFVLLVIGGINAGKSNLVAHLLMIYSHYCNIQNIMYVNPLGRLDPTVVNIQAAMPPKIKFEVFTSLPSDWLHWCAEEVVKQHAPMMSAASVGLFKKGRDHATEIVQTLLPPPDLNHPYTDIFGNPLIHTARLPNDLMAPRDDKPLLFFTAGMKRAYHSQSPRKDDTKPIGYSLDTSHYDNAQDIAGLVKHYRSLTETHISKTDPDKFNVEFASKVRATTDDPDFDLYDPTLEHYRMKINPFAQVLSIDQSNFVAGKENAGVFKDKIFRNGILVADDVNTLFKGVDLSAITNLITEIRHHRLMAIISGQKTTLFPPIVRAQASYACIWATRDKLQLEAMKKDFGPDIPNFERVFKYCTTPTVDVKNPFLYINKTTSPPRVFKCFTEEIKWDANTVEVPSKNTLSSMQHQQHDASSSSSSSSSFTNPSSTSVKTKRAGRPVARAAKSRPG